MDVRAQLAEQLRLNTRLTEERTESVKLQIQRRNRDFTRRYLHAWRSEVTRKRWNNKVNYLLQRVTRLRLEKHLGQLQNVFHMVGIRIQNHAWFQWRRYCDEFAMTQLSSAPRHHSASSSCHYPRDSASFQRHLVAEEELHHQTTHETAWQIARSVGGAGAPAHNAHDSKRRRGSLEQERQELLEERTMVEGEKRRRMAHWRKDRLDEQATVRRSLDSGDEWMWTKGIPADHSAQLHNVAVQAVPDRNCWDFEGGILAPQKCELHEREEALGEERARVAREDARVEARERNLERDESAVRHREQGVKEREGALHALEEAVMEREELVRVAMNAQKQRAGRCAERAAAAREKAVEDREAALDARERQIVRTEKDLCERAAALSSECTKQNMIFLQQMKGKKDVEERALEERNTVLEARERSMAQPEAAPEQREVELQRQAEIAQQDNERLTGQVQERKECLHEEETTIEKMRRTLLQREEEVVERERAIAQWENTHDEQVCEMARLEQALEKRACAVEEKWAAAEAWSAQWEAAENALNSRVATVEKQEQALRTLKQSFVATEASLDEREQRVVDGENAMRERIDAMERREQRISHCENVLQERIDTVEHREALLSEKITSVDIRCEELSAKEHEIHAMTRSIEHREQQLIEMRDARRDYSNEHTRPALDEGRKLFGAKEDAAEEKPCSIEEREQGVVEAENALHSHTEVQMQRDSSQEEQAESCAREQATQEDLCAVEDGVLGGDNAPHGEGVGAHDRRTPINEFVDADDAIACSMTRRERALQERLGSIIQREEQLNAQEAAASERILTIEEYEHCLLARKASCERRNVSPDTRIGEKENVVDKMLVSLEQRERLLHERENTLHDSTAVLQKQRHQLIGKERSLDERLRDVAQRERNLLGKRNDEQQGQNEHQPPGMVENALVVASPVRRSLPLLRDHRMEPLGRSRRRSMEDAAHKHDNFVMSALHAVRSRAATDPDPSSQAFPQAQEEAGSFCTAVSGEDLLPAQHLADMERYFQAEDRRLAEMERAVRDDMVQLCALRTQLEEREGILRDASDNAREVIEANETRESLLMEAKAVFESVKREQTREFEEKKQHLERWECELRGAEEDVQHKYAPVEKWAKELAVREESLQQREQHCQREGDVEQERSAQAMAARVQQRQEELVEEECLMRQREKQLAREKKQWEEGHVEGTRRIQEQKEELAKTEQRLQEMEENCVRESQHTQEQKTKLAQEAQRLQEWEENCMDEKRRMREQKKELAKTEQRLQEMEENYVKESQHMEEQKTKLAQEAQRLQEWEENCVKESRHMQEQKEELIKEEQRLQKLEENCVRESRHMQEQKEELVKEKQRLQKMEENYVKESRHMQEWEENCVDETRRMHEQKNELVKREQLLQEWEDKLLLEEERRRQKVPCADDQQLASAAKRVQIKCVLEPTNGHVHDVRVEAREAAFAQEKHALEAVCGELREESDGLRHQIARMEEEIEVQVRARRAYEQEAEALISSVTPCTEIIDGWENEVLGTRAHSTLLGAVEVRLRKMKAEALQLARERDKLTEDTDAWQRKAIKAEKEASESDTRCVNITEQLQTMQQDVSRLGDQYSKVLVLNEELNAQTINSTSEMQDMERSMSSMKTMLSRRTTEQHALQRKMEAASENLAQSCEDRAILERTVVSLQSRLQKAENEYNFTVAHVRKELSLAEMERVKWKNNWQQMDNEREEWQQKCHAAEKLQGALKEELAVFDRAEAVRAGTLVAECEALKADLSTQVTRLEGGEAFVEWEAGNELEAYSTLVAHMKRELMSARHELQAARKERDDAVQNMHSFSGYG